MKYVLHVVLDEYVIQNLRQVRMIQELNICESFVCQYYCNHSSPNELEAFAVTIKNVSFIGNEEKFLYLQTFPLTISAIKKKTKYSFALKKTTFLGNLHFYRYWM